MNDFVAFVVVLLVSIFLLLAVFTGGFGFTAARNCERMSEIVPEYEWKSFGVHDCRLRAPWGEWVHVDDFEWVQKFEYLQDGE